MKEYRRAEIEVITIVPEDIIVTSSGSETPVDPDDDTNG